MSPSFDLKKWEKVGNRSPKAAIRDKHEKCLLTVI